MEPYTYFKQGFDAYFAGLPEKACPLIFKAWPHECWLMGWRYAEICSKVKSGTMEQQELERILKRPFDQGEVAFAKGVAFDDCPYGPNTSDAYNWQAGWIGASEAEPIPCSQTRNKLIWFAFFLLILSCLLIVKFFLL